MHLSREQLLRWHHHEIPEERAAVVGHLATCATCTAALADLIRTDPELAPSSTFAAADFIARGTGFAPDATTPAPAVGTWRRYWPVAAAAVVVLAVASTVWPDRTDSSAVSTTRGGEAAVTLAAPPDDPAQGLDRQELQFRWEATDAVSSARLIIHDLDAPDRPVVQRETADAHYRLSPDESARLQAGVVYRWFVEYRTVDGLQVTPSWRFRVQ